MASEFCLCDGLAVVRILTDGNKGATHCEKRLMNLKASVIGHHSIARQAEGIWKATACCLVWSQFEKSKRQWGSSFASQMLV